MLGKTIGIISIKGGVGKTSTVSALGASLANDFAKKVLLVDANFSAPNLGFQLGIYNPEVTLHHVLDGKAHINDAIHQSGHGFDVIPGAMVYNFKENQIDPFKLSEKLRDLRRKYDVILIDSSPNMNKEILATMIASDELFMVTTPDYVTLALTLRAMKLAKDRKTPINGLILNKVYNKNFEIGLKEIEEMSGVNVLAVLPHEIEVPEAHAKSIPSTLHKNSESSIEYKKLAAVLIGKEYSEGKFKQFLRKFKLKHPKQEVNRAIFRKSRINNY